MGKVDKEQKDKKEADVSKPIEKLKDEEQFISFHDDPEGRIIFFNKTITPLWLIDKLNGHFICNRNEGIKCWGASV